MPIEHATDLYLLEHVEHIIYTLLNNQNVSAWMYVCGQKSNVTKGSVWLPDADFFWIIPWADSQYWYIYFETLKYTWSRFFKFMYLCSNWEVYLK